MGTASGFTQELKISHQLHSCVFKAAFFNGIFCSHGKKGPLLGSNSTVGYESILTEDASALRIALACLSTPDPSRVRSGILLFCYQMLVRAILSLLHLEGGFCHIAVRSLSAVPSPR